MKQTKYRFILTAFAAVVLLATGCSKEPQDDGGSSATGKMVSVTLPIGFDDATTADTQTTAKGVADAVNTAPAPISSRAAAATTTENGFTVSFGEQMPQEAATRTATTAPAPATRTIAQELINVWVLQFDNTGKNVYTANIGKFSPGFFPLVPLLQVGTGYTICVVANGPDAGLLTTSNPATLADFEAKMLHTTAMTNATKLPISGKLSDVSVIDLGGGRGKISVANSAPAMVVLKRIHAELTLTVDFNVTGYTLTGAQLYNVPAGATYGWNSATTTFPANTVAANFGYTNAAAAGMPPVTTTSPSGTKTTYKWFIGDNRRGEVAGLTAQTDRHSANAPAYSTFARVTLTNSTTSTKKIYYDIYLGSGTLTNFDVKRNHTYTQTATIKGTADFQEALVDVDYRVSGTGFPLVHIFLTDSKAHSPIVISPKSTESTSTSTSTSTMIWGLTISISGAQYIFNGKANTDAIMATIATTYPAAKYCRDQGANYYLPSQAELMLMWICLPAIPVADRPSTSGDFWSSTESSSNTSNAWNVGFSDGYTNNSTKSFGYFVRCVRGADATTWTYPKVENGNTIVSRDAAGGIKSDALLNAAQKTWLLNTNSSTTTYNEKSEYNKVSAKFQVASADVSASSTWADAYTLCKNYSQTGAAAGSWRLPTQRELMLIWMFKSHFGISSSSGGFWSSAESSYDDSGAWYVVAFSSGNTDTNDKNYNYHVRCVRDL